jgi:hypothetical protein
MGVFSKTGAQLGAKAAGLAVPKENIRGTFGLKSGIYVLTMGDLFRNFHSGNGSPKKRVRKPISEQKGRSHQ